VTELPFAEIEAIDTSNFFSTKKINFLHLQGIKIKVLPFLFIRKKRYITLHYK